MADPSTRKVKSILLWPTADTFGKLFECPVCYELILPPVFPCIMGHNICSKCKSNVNQVSNAVCPLCRSPFANCRNVLFEKLLEECRISCKYSSSGCQKLFNGGLCAHELTCDYRPIHCLECNYLVPFDDFITHLAKEKKVDYEGGTGYRTSIEVGYIGLRSCEHVWQPIWLNCLGKDFFLRMEGDGMHWWIFVSVYGVSEVASEFLCELSVFNLDKNISVSYNGPVNGIRSRGSEVCEAGQCICLSRVVLQSLMNKLLGTIEVSVRIRRAPVEASPPEPTTGGKPEHIGSLCQGSKDMPRQPFVSDGTENDDDETEYYMNYSFPVLAHYSIPVSRKSAGKPQPKTTSNPKLDSGNRNGSNIGRGFQMDLLHQDSENESLFRNGSGDAFLMSGPSGMSSNGARRLDRDGSLSPPSLAAPLYSRTEVSFYRLTSFPEMDRVHGPARFGLDIFPRSSPANSQPNPNLVPEPTTGRAPMNNSPRGT